MTIEDYNLQLDQQNMAYSIFSGLENLNQPSISSQQQQQQLYQPNAIMLDKLKELYSKSPIATIGCRVRVINTQYAGTIKDVLVNTSLDNVAFEIELDNNAGTVHYNLRQVVLLDVPNKFITEKEYNKIITEGIIERINNLKKGNKDQIKNQINSAKSYIEDYTKKIKQYERDIVTFEKMDKTPLEVFNYKSFDKFLTSMKNHPYLTDAYITKKKALCFITKPLRRDTGKKFLPGSIGRFEILINAFTISDIRISNLDYYYGDYHHPNIENSHMCWGDNEREVRDMLQKCEIEQFIDFTLICLTAYPQDEGSNPYIDPDEWFEEKEKIKGEPEEKL
jgi:hypothetical protein